jgi:CubicO group peptidase (beta-lactamase class C family)
MSDLGLPMAACPEEIGLSTERLNRIRNTLRQDVERQLIPGAVMLIARGGRIGFAEAIGFRDRDADAPMTLDAIFRIASMTKTVTAVAAMILAEEGKLQIAAPVADYLPELAEPTIGIERARARRTMTVQDLMRHTSGFTYGIIGDSPVKRMWREAELFTADQTNAELVTKIARLPLIYEPGTTWEYGHSTDVLGRVIEVASGQELADFIDARISRPLGLADTGFAAIGEKVARIAEAQIGERPPMHYRVTDPGRRWAEGGGGAVSTAADFVRFCQMLLNGGELDGVRILSPKTVALMTSDHLPPDCADPAGLAVPRRRRQALPQANGAIMADPWDNLTAVDENALPPTAATESQSGPWSNMIPISETAPSNAATPWSRFKTGAMDPLYGGAQIGARMMAQPGGGDPMAALAPAQPDETAEVDKAVNDREAAYQEQRHQATVGANDPEAVGMQPQGADWWRLAGNVASPFNLAAGAGSPGSSLGEAAILGAGRGALTALCSLSLAIILPVRKWRRSAWGPVPERSSVRWDALSPVADRQTSAPWRMQAST